MLKLIHISDLHIGKVFSSYPDQVRKALQAARLDSLADLVAYANDQQVQVLAIAGDLFDRINVSQGLISQTCEILRGFQGLTLTLPGNHDFYTGSEELWQTFQDKMDDGSLLLKETRPYDLADFGIDAVVYPAPCQSKHSASNNLAWIKDEDLDPNRLNIGLAHGALEGLSPDLQGEYFPMSRQELDELGLDLWLIGHTHVPYPLLDEVQDHRIFNAGTHEPDGMNYAYEGSAFYIQVSKDLVKARRLITGKYRFKEVYDRLETSLAEYLGQFEAGYDHTLLRLNLSGYIEEEDYQSRYDIYDDLANKVFYLEVRDEDLKIRLTPDKISEKFVAGSFPEVMLLKLQDNEAQLQLAYDLIEESRKDQ